MRKSAVILLIILSVIVKDVVSIWDSESVVSKYKWTADLGGCTEPQRDDITESESVVTYAGQSVLLSCNICHMTDMPNTTWMYAKNLNENGVLLKYTKHMVLYSNGNLQIYDVQSKDAGVYTCIVFLNKGRTNILEVIEEKDYSLIPVKTKEAIRGKDPAKEFITGNVSVYTKWTPWSLCSTCDEGSVGIRYSIGTCYVKEANGTTTVKGKTFKYGIWCHSKILPAQYKKISEVKKRKNEIMTGLCKMECNNDSKIQVTEGREMDAHPNMKNKHGHLEGMPVSFHLPTMSARHANEGEQIVIECHGHLLSDVTKRWTRDDDDGNTIREEIFTKKKERIRVTPTQKLVVDSARVADSGSYSCWKLDELVCHVKLKVYPGHILEKYVSSILSFIICGVLGAVLLFCNIKIYLLHRRLKDDNRYCDQKQIGDQKQIEKADTVASADE